MLPILLILVIAGLLTTNFMLGSMDAVTLRYQKEQKTYQALSEAKAALIGWSAKHTSLPGSLPCTDITNDGTARSSGQSCVSYIGRLPWRTLGLGDIRDGDGECLWYALTPIYRNVLPTSARNAASSNQINVTVPGSLTVKSADGSTAPINPVIAVIFSVGSPLGGQDRSDVSGGTCGGNYTAANYLETLNAVNNATGNVIGLNYTFTRGTASDAFNDKLMVITASDLYRPVRKRIVREIMGKTNTTDGVHRYFVDNGTYLCPSATVLGGPGDCSVVPPSVTGYANNAGMGLNYPVLGNWLANNNWFGVASYVYISPTNVSVSITDALGAYSCIANSGSVTCS